MPKPHPAPALIEIIEADHVYNPEDPRTGYVKPNMIRINGVPVAVPADVDIRVHGLCYEGDRDEALQVTITMFARKVVYGYES